MALRHEGSGFFETSQVKSSRKKEHEMRGNRGVCRWGGIGYRKNAALLALCMTLVSTDIFAQAKEWKKITSDGGKVAIEYCISEIIDEGGATGQLIEYTVKTLATVGYESCMAAMRDIANNKALMGATQIETVEATAQNESIFYYYYTGNPFVPAYDCVAKMNCLEDSAKKTATVEFSAIPSMYKASALKRAELMQRRYIFKDVGSGKVEITITVKMSPPFTVPLWMLKAGVPGSAGKDMSKLVALVKAV
jgi:hypothetical protein